MRISRWILKATNTHFAFALQQWLHELASMFRYTHLASLLYEVKVFSFKGNVLKTMTMGDWWNDCDTETPKHLMNTLLLRHFVRNVFCSTVPRLCLLGAVTTCF
jgi:hypothetical protein